MIGLHWQSFLVFQGKIPNTSKTKIDVGGKKISDRVQQNHRTSVTVVLKKGQQTSKPVDTHK